MDKRTENTIPSVLTAPTLSELMDKLEAAMPPGKFVVVKESSIICKDGEWSVEYYLKDRI